MIYIKITSTKAGRIWVLKASENGLFRKDFNSKIDFQRAVTDSIVKDVLRNARVKRLENGAPIIEGDEHFHVSISHSGDYFSLYLSKEVEVGVDIELRKKSLFEGRHYFLNEVEMKTNWTDIELYVIWGMKEALYKMKQGNINDLNAEVTAMEIGESTAKAAFEGEVVSFGIEYFETGILVFSV